MEQLVNRLDVAMFNAILRESADEMHRLVTGQDGFQICLALMTVTLMKITMKMMTQNTNLPSNLSLS